MEHLARQAERRHLSLICSISTFTTGPQELREEQASEQANADTSWKLLLYGQVQNQNSVCSSIMIFLKLNMPDCLYVGFTEWIVHTQGRNRVL